MHDEIDTHFIPFSRWEVMELLEREGALDEAHRPAFRELAKLFSSLFHFSFHEEVERLKRAYFPFNPDHRGDRVPPDPDQARAFQEELIGAFTRVLTAANYTPLGDEALQYARDEESLFHISVQINLDDFDTYLMFSRGEHTITEKVPRLLLFKKEVEIPCYERIVLLIKFKECAHIDCAGSDRLPFEPGTMVIKLFKEIPKADLEMLFPNATVRMRVKDKMIMGVPAIGGGVWVLLKTFTGLVAFLALLGAMIGGIFTGGALTYPSPRDMAQLIGGVASLMVLGAFVFKQWSKYKNRKLLFMKALGENLYYKNLDSNAGVFHHLVDEAEEEENKEVLLAYYFLLTSESGLTEAELDQRVEEWFQREHGTVIDFEVDDALRKLETLGVCRRSEDNTPRYSVLSIEESCRLLDHTWDNYFKHNI